MATMTKRKLHRIDKGGYILNTKFLLLKGDDFLCVERSYILMPQFFDVCDWSLSPLMPYLMPFEAL